MFEILRSLTYLMLLCTWSVCVLALDSSERKDSNSKLYNVTVQGWSVASGTYLTTCKNYKLSDYDTRVVKSYLISDNIIHFLLGKTEFYTSHSKGIDIMHENHRLKLNILNMKNCTTMANIQIDKKLKEIEVRDSLPIYFDKMFKIRMFNEEY
ncbi:hypothetical protein TSAR_010437 [Trichomalopsis sarcophagae]|uniref:Uncharacterized protein n=1 Tax=Trichomalopsis sarcophagae TaxID=543379 RepID=A0A232ESV9_9HYME|nr:hypothetical protein TSAR_010437 [Trichomalopsis sarcophagae]